MDDNNYMNNDNQSSGTPDNTDVFGQSSGTANGSDTYSQPQDTYSQPTDTYNQSVSQQESGNAYAYGQSSDQTGVRYDDNVHTTLAFVQTAADGDRDFSFYRNPGADMMLTADEVDLSLVRNAKIFHFGSLSMTDKICENATKHAIAAAKEAGVLISFDPNLRKPLWKSMDDAKEKISWGLSQCDILKISDDEIEFMTGEKDIKTGVKKLIDEYHIPFICATMGKNGSMAFFDGHIVEAAPFLRDDTVETTGAGDTFCACLLHDVLEHGINDRKDDDVKKMLTFANAAASLITTRKGALRVMPEKGEVEAVIK